MEMIVRVSVVMKWLEYVSHGSLHDAEWISAGMSNATIFSYSGYQYSSPSPGDGVPLPSYGSGLIMIPTKPISTQRSISSNVLVIGTPAHCGSPATPRYRVGASLTLLAMASLLACTHHWTIFSGFSECINWNGRGDRNWMSVPTLSMLLARWFLTAFDIASSVMPGLPLPCAPREASRPDL